MNEIDQFLKDNQDDKYASFSRKLIPNTKYFILGIRTPEIKRFAKKLVKENNYQSFISSLPHTYFEENQLHACILSYIKDYQTTVKELDRFLDYIDNWATCDQLKQHIAKEHKKDFLIKIKEYILSDKTYHVRFGADMLMDYFYNDFSLEYFSWLKEVKNDDYYVKMGIAWYLSVALVKRYDEVIPYFESQYFPTWIHNKAIQKARESYRISEEKKEYIKKLKID